AGWLSSWLFTRGWTVNRARKAAMLLCAVCVVPIVTVSRTSGLWTAVLVIGLAAAAHQGWSANLFTTASDMFPKWAVGSVVGLGGMAGAAGGLLFSPFIGYILQHTHNNYLIPFFISGSAYLAAFAVIQALAPRLEPAALDGSGVRG
ncbi:MAG TPA: MFS transporter, partial [Burkholderiales bacterium]|nr:MFS transporter [Burkholderiales bacterium]